MAQNLNLGTAVDFQTGFQDGLVNNRGVQMIHEIGLACTCRVEDVYASTRDDGEEARREPFCTRCGRDGYLFRSPALITGIFTGARHQRNVLDSGIYLPGDAIFSPTPNYPTCDGDGRHIGTADKLTATWPEPIDEGHVLIRGSGSKAAAEGIITMLDDDEDRLWYEPASSIWCEDEFGVVYQEGTDFELGPGKIIKWVGGQPDVGVRFSIKYNAYFEWIAFQPPTERRDRDGRNLGELVNLRKRHVQLINTSPFATSEDKRSLQARVSC
jgi:hypothetical protein